MEDSFYMNRQYGFPFETMYCASPPAYLAPEQSRYHNLGMNGYITPGQPYPDRRPGFLGDYGPRQEGDMQSVAHGIYPLDADVINFNKMNNYRMIPFVKPQKMSLKSAKVLAAGINTCNPYLCNPYNPNCAPHY